VCLRAGLDWCGKSRFTGIRSPDRPARRQSLYRLRCPAHQYVRYLTKIPQFQGLLSVVPPRSLLWDSLCNVANSSATSPDDSLVYKTFLVTTDAAFSLLVLLNRYDTVSSYYVITIIVLRFLTLVISPCSARSIMRIRHKVMMCSYWTAQQKKVKLTLEQATKAHGRCRGIALLFL